MRKKQEKDKYVCGGKRTGRIRKKNGEEKKRTNERGASLKKKKMGNKRRYVMEVHDNLVYGS